MEFLFTIGSNVSGSKVGLFRPTTFKEKCRSRLSLVGLYVQLIVLFPLWGASSLFQLPINYG